MDRTTEAKRVDCLAALHRNLLLQGRWPQTLGAGGDSAQAEKTICKCKLVRNQKIGSKPAEGKHVFHTALASRLFVGKVSRLAWSCAGSVQHARRLAVETEARSSLSACRPGKCRRSDNAFVSSLAENRCCNSCRSPMHPTRTSFRS
ncbi:hypothetical protein, variant [Cladophialophora immunda]|uniref:Uncharacterized protein n=1 Tax=Cladophialophora immunda TaxID=569365 RepID=A0A0D2AUB7_9EURO|nr:uncharacterized protein PV07_04698 [Cladophialophora immunda]XP_016249049.1 hypothetical protein, variant [Cladophialophora immunda]KIW28832.1 hypothetical protein PV07_04698 [Cladophialophora immunda]KIW28833.1 hypothetical protein, variant [Cladophialophora immunda]